MNKLLPDEPKFIQNATATQKWLSGIAVSMFITVWVTGWNAVVDIFKPDFVQALTYLRMSIALIGIGITSTVGYQRLKNMAEWGIEWWEMYKQVSEFKRRDKRK